MSEERELEERAHENMVEDNAREDAYDDETEALAATVCAICNQPAPAGEKHSCDVAGTTWTPGRPSGVPAYGKPEPDLG